MILNRKLKKDFTYRNLGGDTFEIEFEISKKDVLWEGLLGNNWACYNFIERRKDFNNDFKHKLYYGKINNLGYIIAEDELEG